MLIFDVDAVCYYVSLDAGERPQTADIRSRARHLQFAYIHEISLFKLRKSVAHGLAYIKEMPTEKDPRSDSLETPDM